jgi:septal ring factor EnvC (AmiA/AmiB activator)
MAQMITGEVVMRRVAVATVALILMAGIAGAQDIRGLEVCTAEKQMERRTSCLQSNVEFLQQTLNRTTRETQEKIGALTRELAAAKAETAALKAELTKLRAEFTELTKAKAAAPEQPAKK